MQETYARRRKQREAAELEGMRLGSELGELRARLPDVLAEAVDFEARQMRSRGERVTLPDGTVELASTQALVIEALELSPRILARLRLFKQAGGSPHQLAEKLLAT